MTDKIWLNQYPSGVATEININEYDSLADIFNESVQKYAHNTAFISMGKKISYQELDHLSASFATWLQKQGIAKGSRIALMMPNLLQYPVCLFGALRAGYVVVNCNPLYTERELEHQLNNAQAEVIVIVENFANTLEKTLPNLKYLNKIIVTSIGDLLGGIKKPLVNFIIKHIKKMVPHWHLPNHYRLDHILSSTDYQQFTPVTLKHEDIAFLQYTGGTTGLSKGAVLSHGNIVANVLQAYEWVQPYAKPEKEFIITALPLYHIFALTANCLTFFRLGAQNLLIVNPRDIPGFVKEISKYPFTAFTGVNTLFNALLHNEDFKRLNFSHLKLTLGGGMAVQTAIAHQWHKVTGCHLAQAYGLTETSPAVSINPLHKPVDGSIGLAVSSTDINIRDESGKTLAPKEVGEICVKGPQVMQGYWNDPAETEKVFTPDGYLLTGDMGYMDEQGYIFLVDRKKDMIIVSGFNVYPNEIEEVLSHHPKIKESAAIGVDNGPAGETVKVFIVKDDESLTEQEVIDYCRQQLTAYKVPKRIEFREDLPKTNVGKILRRALKG